MAKTITTRLPDEFVKQLKQIAQKESLDTSSVIRRLLAHAIAEWRKDYAVEQYKKGEDLTNLENSSKHSHTITPSKHRLSAVSP